MNAKVLAAQMKVTCRPAVLGQALQVVSRAISSRTTLPILNNILIETTAEGLALTATNLEIGIRKLVPAEVAQEGQHHGAGPAADRFRRHAARPGPRPDARLHPPSRSTCAARGSTRTSSASRPRSFRPGRGLTKATACEVALDELVSAVEQTQMAASTDEARPGADRGPRAGRREGS